MPELIGIFDGGIVITRRSGYPHGVGLIIFRQSINEAAPVDLILECEPCYKDSTIKYLKKLRPYKPEPAPGVITAGERKKPEEKEAGHALPANSLIVPEEDIAEVTSL